VSGGAQVARAGKLTVMVGGNQEVFDEALPVMRAYGGLIKLLGPVGSGQLAKLVNNLLLFANAVTGDAALNLGSALGVDTAGLREVLLAGSARSSALDSHDRLFMDGRIRASTHAEKDVSLAIDVARSSGVELGPLGALAQTVLDMVGGSR
jgi:3-hydroxyisobutyrate dehydrogenase-like beta-hydroxyacid dehydrogenase